LNLPSNPSLDYPRKSVKGSTFRKQVQAHTHWVNDILVSADGQSLVSASSDLTVKLWRPHSPAVDTPQTIGRHSDYVKCLAAPSNFNWIASGGLDRKIRLWDADGGGEQLVIDVGDGGDNPKGSVYALGAGGHGGSVLASGGPESVVRVWDPRSGERITKFVGHTDNIRSILVSDDGGLILSASSDTTVKLWSLAERRCIHTLSHHNDSVWSLFSRHPRLEIFHSSDRSGLVAKSDLRNTRDLDEGISVAVCQEHEGVSRVIASGDNIWTATSSSSINRWSDVDTNTEIVKTRDAGPARSHKHKPSGSSVLGSPVLAQRPNIPVNALLRLSSTGAAPSNVRDPDAVTVYSISSQRRASIPDADLGIVVPINEAPEETIQGHHGLIKHFILNDRRRVLTVDTSGDVVLWDLLKCCQVKSFGKRELEDVAAEVNTVESVANWCTVNTRTGALTCVLEESTCFDAEMYADQIELENPIDFREDQRSKHSSPFA
jgi:WD repeat-containing protein 48